MVLSEINAKLAKIHSNMDSLTLAGTDMQSIETGMENLFTSLSARLDEFKSLIETPGQGLSLARFLEEFKRTTKDHRADIDSLGAAVDRISQLAGDMQTTKGQEDMANNIRVIYDMVDRVWTKTDYIDTRIAGMGKMHQNVESIIGGTEIKVESPQVNHDNAAVQRSLIATTLTAMEWTKALISGMERMQTSIAKIEGLADIHSKPAPATMDIKNDTQKLESSICTVEAKLGEVKEVVVAINKSFSRLGDSMMLRVKCLEEKVDGSTKKLGELGGGVQQDVGNLAMLVAYYNRGQGDIQSSIRQMQSQMDARLCRIEEALLKKVEASVPMESTSAPRGSTSAPTEPTPTPTEPTSAPIESTEKQGRKLKWSVFNSVLAVLVRNPFPSGGVVDLHFLIACMGLTWSFSFLVCDFYYRPYIL